MHVYVHACMRGYMRAHTSAHTFAAQYSLPRNVQVRAQNKTNRIAAADTDVRPKMAPGEKDNGEAAAALPPADDPAAPSAL